MRQSSNSANEPHFPLWTAFTAMGSDQWAAAAGSTTAMLNGLESMRKTQENATHQAAKRHAAAAERLKNGCSATELATIQANLLRSDLEGVTEYVQRIAATTMEMHTRIFGAWTRTIDTTAVMESLSTITGKSH